MDIHSVADGMNPLFSQCFNFSLSSYRPSPLYQDYHPGAPALVQETNQLGRDIASVSCILSISSSSSSLRYGTTFTQLRDFEHWVVDVGKVATWYRVFTLLQLLNGTVYFRTHPGQCILVAKMAN